MGKIGSAVAKRANGFGMRVLYHNRNRREDDEKQFGEILIIFVRPEWVPIFMKGGTGLYSKLACSNKKFENGDCTTEHFCSSFWIGRGRSVCIPLNLPSPGCALVHYSKWELTQFDPYEPQNGVFLDKSKVCPSSWPVPHIFFLRDMVVFHVCFLKKIHVGKKGSLYISINSCRSWKNSKQ